MSPFSFFKSRKKKFFVVATALLLSSCASYIDKQKKLLTLYKTRAYKEAFEELESSPLKESSKNRLLYLLEKASLFEKLGESKKAQKAYIEADKVVDELYTTSVLKTAASFIHNDSVTDYDGELFERITIHTLLAFSFLKQGNLKAARVEAKKINSRLYEFTKELGDTNNRYKKDAFALYLSGIIYESLGELDDALIDYKKALEIYEDPNYQEFYFGEIKEQIAKSLYRLSLLRRRNTLAQTLKNKYPDLLKPKKTETGELVVLHAAGHISLKEAKNFFLPIGGQVVRFSYPIISPRGPYFAQTGVLTSGGTFVEAKNAAYMSAIAHATIEDKRLRLVAKGLARVLLKSQINRAVEENLGFFAGLVSNIVTASTETADTRSWMFMPDAFFVTRLKLPVGKQMVQTINNGYQTEPFPITIKKNKITLLKAASR